MSPYDTPVALAALTIGLLVLLGAAVIANVRHHKTPTPTRPAAQMPRAGEGSTVPYHCATYGHYFVRRYSDRWRCAKCGALSDVVGTDDVADIEAHANGEAS